MKAIKKNEVVYSNRQKEQRKRNKHCFAVPVDNDVLSAHFGHCDKFILLHVANDEITGIEIHNPPEHVPGLYPEWLTSLSVSDVIAGGIGQRAIELFNRLGINVFAGSPAKPAEELVKEFLSGELVLNENYCDHREKHNRCEGHTHSKSHDHSDGNDHLKNHNHSHAHKHNH